MEMASLNFLANPDTYLKYLSNNIVKLFELKVVVCAVLSLAAALPQRRVSLKPEGQQVEDQQPAEQNYNNYQPQQEFRPQPQEYRQAKPVEDFRPKVQLDTTTFIPIIRFDKEQGTDGSYKTA
jgi:hypothetical protein